MNIARRRIDFYFEDNHLSRAANGLQKTKGALLAIATFLLYLALLRHPFGSLAALAGCALLGIMTALVGMNVAHDAAHNAYSDNGLVNRVLARVYDLLGISSFIWKKTHNINHHTYTNVSGQDSDIDQAVLLRIDPHRRLRPFHRYQHLYIWLAYALLLLNWIFYFDYRYLLENRPGFRSRDIALMLLFKLANLTLFLGLPMLLAIRPWPQVLLGYLAMQLTCGLFLAVVFAVAHLVEPAAFPLPDEDGTIQNAWGVHQLMTTSDFSANRPLTSFLLGGLNHQIEHHLFPGIAHCHYPQLARIVKATALELGLPFHEHPSMAAALGSHVRTLYRLGRPLTAAGA